MGRWTRGWLMGGWLAAAVVLIGCPVGDDDDATGDDDSADDDDATGDDDDATGDDDDATADDDDATGDDDDATADDDDATGDDDDSTPSMGTLHGQTYTYYDVPQNGTLAGGAEIVARDAAAQSFGPVTSDAQTAYYELELPAGTYDVFGSLWGYSAMLGNVVVGEGASVELDIYFYMDDVDAPYIYLYPETATSVNVELEPAPGTFVHTSWPLYQGGWTVLAEPSGLLDGQYDFLYYEATVQWVFQTAEGWAVDGGDPMGWFEAALPGMGLNADEIDDFVDFWAIHLPAAGCYLVYPQDPADIDLTMGLTIDPAPDQLLRLWLVVAGAPTCPTLPAPPAATPFLRDGFAAVEWGVVLDAETF